MTVETSDEPGKAFAEATVELPLLAPALARSEVMDSTFAPYFIAGTTLYLVYRSSPNLLLWGLLGVTVAMAVPLLERRVAPLTRTTLIILFILFGLMMLLSPGKLSWLRFPGIMTLGALTYPAYLLHRQSSWVAVVHLHEAMPARLLIAAIVAAVLALAFLTHRLVERALARFLRRGLKASFAQVRAAQPVAVSSASRLRDRAAERLDREIPVPSGESTPSGAPGRASDLAFARSLETHTSRTEETADA